ncbi:MAG: PQQ-binding-like beta-propeller repeat protein, partial [Wenzhouxiangellaceae bacterium]
MAWFRPALAVLLLAFLAGCNTFGKKDEDSEPMELQDIDASVRVEKLWSNKVGRGPGRGGAGLRPTHADGQLWVADRRGKIEVLDGRSGKVARRLDLDLKLSAGPAVFDEYVAVGTINGQAVLIERDSGQVLWRAQLSSEILSPPLLRDDVLVVRCIDGRIFGLNV